jgi:hypothetical protein
MTTTRVGAALALAGALFWMAVFTALAVLTAVSY